MHSPNSQPTHAHNSSYSLPKQTLTLLLIPVNLHRAVQLPLLTTQTQVYTLPLFITHTCPKLLLFLTQTHPFTPPYSCDSIQSLQLPLLTTQTQVYTLPLFITHTCPQLLSFLTLLLILVNPHRAVQLSFFTAHTDPHPPPPHPPSSILPF
jgi:hypothetical protein